jgi:hypothetical protein
MKATKDHIGLEMAKLLKDCRVESRDRFCELFVEIDGRRLKYGDMPLYIKDNVNYYLF